METRQGQVGPREREGEEEYWHIGKHFTQIVEKDCVKTTCLTDACLKTGFFRTLSVGNWEMILKFPKKKVISKTFGSFGIPSYKTERLYKEMNRHIFVTLSVLVDSQIHKSYELDLLMNWLKWITDKLICSLTHWISPSGYWINIWLNHKSLLSSCVTQNKPRLCSAWSSWELNQSKHWLVFHMTIYTLVKKRYTIA